jgi:beta-glucosidase/6-phospho-beta-glucosidase/beta-galactosidase
LPAATCCRLLQAGKIGIALNIEYLEPWTDSPVDKAAAQTGLEGALGWFADPLFFGEPDCCSAVCTCAPVAASTVMFG